MSEQAVADEPKKEEKKSPSKKESYDEAVAVRHWDGTKFLNPVQNVPAFRGEVKGRAVVYTIPKADNARAPKGSEITDKDGVVWVVTESRAITGNFTYNLNYVEKKK